MSKTYCQDAINLAMLAVRMMPPEVIAQVIGPGEDVPIIAEALQGNPRHPLAYIGVAANMLAEAEDWLEHDIDQDQHGRRP